MRKRITSEEFVERATKMHGNKYDYSQIRFVNTNTKVKIICPKHGAFMQLPSAHMRGNGCKQCSSEQRALTNDEFIIRAKLLFGDKYDYSKTKYENMYSDVDIVCLKHGSFSVEPMTFLRGCGCPKCRG